MQDLALLVYPTVAGLFATFAAIAIGDLSNYPERARSRKAQPKPVVVTPATSLPTRAGRLTGGPSNSR